MKKWSFWATVVAFVGIVVATAGCSSDGEIPRSELREILIEAVKTADSEAAAAVDDAVDELYAPVYEAIPAYVDFRYATLPGKSGKSLGGWLYDKIHGESRSSWSLGGWIYEITHDGWTLGGWLYEKFHGQTPGGFIHDKIHDAMSEELQTHLFKGFGADLDKAGSKLDGLFVEEYERALDSGVGGLDRMGPRTKLDLRKSLNRAKTTTKVASTVVGLAGAKEIGAIVTTLTAKMVKKLLPKAAIKEAVKRAAALGGGTGALTCAWAGPLAVVCAAVGAASVSVATDAYIVTVDKWRNSDKFKDDLEALIDRDKASKKQLFRDALAQKAKEVKDFTLRELHEQTPR